MTLPLQRPMNMSAVFTEFGQTRNGNFSRMLGKAGAPSARPLNLSYFLGKAALSPHDAVIAAVQAAAKASVWDAYNWFNSRVDSVTAAHVLGMPRDTLAQCMAIYTYLYNALTARINSGIAQASAQRDALVKMLDWMYQREWYLAGTNAPIDAALATWHGDANAIAFGAGWDNYLQAHTNPRTGVIEKLEWHRSDGVFSYPIPSYATGNAQMLLDLHNRFRSTTFTLYLAASGLPHLRAVAGWTTIDWPIAVSGPVTTISVNRPPQAVIDALVEYARTSGGALLPNFP